MFSFGIAVALAFMMVLRLTSATPLPYNSLNRPLINPDIFKGFTDEQIKAILPSVADNINDIASSHLDFVQEIVESIINVAKYPDDSVDE